MKISYVYTCICLSSELLFDFKDVYTADLIVINYSCDWGDNMLKHVKRIPIYLARN